MMTHVAHGEAAFAVFGLSGSAGPTARAQACKVEHKNVPGLAATSDAARTDVLPLLDAYRLYQ